MFKTRLLSGILLVLIALVAVISGGRVLFGVVLCISLLGMSELYKVFGVEKNGLGIAGYLAALLYYLLLYLKHYTHVFEQIKPGMTQEQVRRTVCALTAKYPIYA